MSTIAALEDKDGVWIGSDSQITDRGGVLPVSFQKWTTHNEWAIGTCGCPRTQLVVEEFIARQLRPNLRPAQVVNLLRDIVIKDREDDSEERDVGFIIANAKRGVFAVGPNFDMNKITFGEMYADGSGRQFAMGAGAVCSDLGSEERMQRSIAAAIKLDAYSGGDIYIERLTQGG